MLRNAKYLVYILLHTLRNTFNISSKLLIFIFIQYENLFKTLR